MRPALSLAAFAAACSGALGCSYATVEPGHRGLLFEPNGIGLQREALQPGRYRLHGGDRVEDFAVTYATRREAIDTLSSEGLPMRVELAVIYRPIISELYELDTEVGPDYYDAVIKPELRSAGRDVLARYSFADLQTRNERIEDEIENDLRRRMHGRHVEVASVNVDTEKK
jgi:regulator of protease activity HflC (stomatin/prohibitin superfamily)